MLAKHLFIRCLYVVAGVLILQPVSGQLKLPALFSDHMVLQKDAPIRVWGWATPRELLTINLGDESVKTTADEEGRWEVSLKERSAVGPWQLEVSGKDSVVTFEDILMGEVWVCSGQSNMEWPVSMALQPEKELEMAEHERIRLFTVPNKMAVNPQEDIAGAGSWQVCEASSLAGFSAVGYFFGRSLHDSLDVPIGLIDATWGGTNVETWTSTQAFQNDPELGPIADSLRFMDLEEELEKSRILVESWENVIDVQDIGLLKEWYADTVDWTGWDTIAVPQLWESTELPGVDGVVWFKTQFELNEADLKSPIQLHLGPIDDSDITYLNGQTVGKMTNQYNVDRIYEVSTDILQSGLNTLTVRVKDTGGGGGLWGQAEQVKVVTTAREIPLAGDWRYQVGVPGLPTRPAALGPNSKPALLYNAMIHPLIPLRIRGAIWYQGESNASEAVKYRKRFPLMIQDWRSHWGIGDFPFLFVQLANYMAEPNLPGESNWAELREAQAMALGLAATGMACTIDIGEADDIHPKNKQEVGRRLSLEALRIVYGKELVSRGPSLKAFSIEDNKIRLYYNGMGSGLVNRGDGDQLRGFAVAGQNGVFRWAEARLERNSVVVYSEKVEKPLYVRYAWADNPGELDLYNAEGLPAEPFRTDLNRRGKVKGD